MDRLERFESPQDALMKALTGWQSNMWTVLPVVVQSYDSTAMTCELQPTILANFKSPVDGKTIWKKIPILRDCPVVFPSGGGVSLTFPIAPGDEGLVLFSSRCIDSWWAYSDVQEPPYIRMHNLSDGFYLPGVKSKPKVLSNVSTTETQLRSNDGNTVIGLNASTSTLTLKATTINVTGAMNVTGNVTTTGTLTNNGKSVGSALRVSGVTTGSGTSGTPV